MFTCFLCNNSWASELSITLPRTITQDSDGFIWVGTQTNVKRYDGHHFTSLAKHYGYINKVINHQQITYVAASKAVVAINKQLQETVLFQAQPNNEILDLVLSEHYLYVLLQKQLISINLNKTSKPHYVLYSFNSITNGRITALNKEICFANLKKFTCINSKTKDTFTLNSPETIRDLLVDKTRTSDIIIATQHSLYQYDYYSRYLTLVKHFNNNNKITKVARVANTSTKLWLVINNQIKRFNLATKKFEKHNFQRQLTSRIYDIYQSSDNTLWLAATTLEKYPQTNILVSNIKNLTQTSGMAWFIHYFAQYLIIDANGVHRLNNQTLAISPYKNINKLTQGNLYSALALNGDLFVGGYYGLFKIEPNDDTVINLSALINYDTVQCIRPINSYQLAICTANNGVYFVNTKNNTAKKYFSNPSIVSIVDFLLEKNDVNNVWIATDVGLYHLSNKHLTRYLPQSHVIRLVQQNNTLYAATIGDGLYKIKRFDQAVQINKLNGIGERVNDIVLKDNMLTFTTALGMGTYNTITAQVTTAPLGYSVGRILVDVNQQKAISSNGKLITWTSHSQAPLKKKQSHLHLSNYLVNGKNALLKTPLDDNDFVELIFSTNTYRATELHTFRTKINDHPWNQFSSINQLSFLPSWGENTIIIQAKNGDTTLTKKIQFYVNYPWYVSNIAKLFYGLLLLYFCYALLLWFVNNKRKFIKQQNKHLSAIEKIKSKNKQNLAKLIKKSNAIILNNKRSIELKNTQVMSKILDANTYICEIDYQPIVEKIDSISALILIGQYDKAIDNAETLSNDIQITAALAAPDIITNTDIVSALQLLIMSKLSQKFLLHIEYTNTPIFLPETEKNSHIIRCLYKCIYELLTYIIEELSISTINMSLTQVQNSLSLTIDIEDNRLTLASFNDQNLSLYQVALLAYKLEATLAVESQQNKNISIVLTIPLGVQNQVNFITNNVNFKDE